MNDPCYFGVWGLSYALWSAGFRVRVVSDLSLVAPAYLDVRPAFASAILPCRVRLDDTSAASLTLGLRMAVNLLRVADGVTIKES